MRTARPAERALHLFAACGFAIAQPLFDIAGRNPAFLYEHGIERWRVVAFAAAVIVIAPLPLIALERCASAVAPRLGRFVQVAAIGGLGAIAIAPVVVRRVASLPAVAVLLAAAVLVAYVYDQTQRLWTWLAPAPLLFAVAFLASAGVRQFLQPAPAVERHGAAPSARSAVVVLFDEISLGSLLEPDGSIDAIRFPNVARLAAGSTWFRNATANAGWSTAAVPSLLTGRYPTWSRGPGFAYYARFPDNLFTAAARTHDVRSFEAASRLCPPRVCPPPRTPFRSARHIAADSAFLLAQRTLPRAAEGWLPPIGARWAGFLGTRASVERRIARMPGPLRPVVRAVTRPFTDDEPSVDRVEAIDDLFGTIERPERPTVWFLDVIYPHFPWDRLPDLRAYPDPGVEGWAWPREDRWTADTGVMAHQLQRYMLQLRSWDALLGRLIDRLEATGVWDDAVVVVAADQGLSLDPGEPRRTVERRNAADVMPVPLFVRTPGGRAGAVDERNAELVDVLPTLADALDLEVRFGMDGASLLGPDPGRSAKAHYSLDGRRLTFPASLGTGTFAANVRRTFGPGGGPDDLYGTGPGRRLLGRATPDRSLVVEGPATLDTPDPSAPVLPIVVQGAVRGSGASWAAVAVDGTVAGVGPVYGPSGDRRFVVMLSPRHLAAGVNRLSYVALDADGRPV